MICKCIIQLSLYGIARMHVAVHFEICFNSIIYYRTRRRPVAGAPSRDTLHTLQRLFLNSVLYAALQNTQTTRSVLLYIGVLLPAHTLRSAYMSKSIS